MFELWRQTERGWCYYLFSNPLSFLAQHAGHLFFFPKVADFYSLMM